MEKKTRIRSKDYPPVSLGTAFEFIKVLKDYIMVGSITYTQAASILGVSTNTNSFKRKLSAAKQFGLVETKSNEIIFMTTSKHIAFPTDSTDENAIARDCFLNPKLYEEIYNLYKEKPLLKLAPLENVLIQKMGIAPNAAGLAASAFLETVEEFNYTVQGNLSLETDERIDSENDNADSLENEEDVPTNEPVKTTPKKQVYPQDEVFIVEIPLGEENVSLTVPKSIPNSKLKKIPLLIKAYFDVLLSDDED